VSAGATLPVGDLRRSLTAWPGLAGQTRTTAREWAALAAIIVIACALRLIQVGYSFDTDEVFSVHLASRPLAQVIDGALWDRSHPPLHILLLHVWLNVFGVSEPAARALSIVLAVGFLVAAHAVARRVAGPLAALVAAALLAASPFFTYYGQQARPYSLIAALSAVNLLLFLRGMDRPAATGRWIAWAASAALLVHTQYLGVMLLGMEALIALLCLRVAAWRPLAWLAAGVATILPWVWAAMGHKLAEGELPLDLISWMFVPGGADLVYQVAAPFGDGPLRARWVALIALAIVFAGGALWLRRRQLDAQRLLLALGALGVPVAVFVVARVLDEPIFAPRQLIGASFCLVVLVAAAACALPRLVTAAVVAGLIACSLLSMKLILPAFRNPDWPAIAAFLDQERSGAPVRSLEPWVTDPLSFYRRRGPVYGRTSMTAGLQGEANLLVCRPERCDPHVLGEDVTLLREWRWGRGELRVYEGPVANRRN